MGGKSVKYGNSHCLKRETIPKYPLQPQIDLKPVLIQNEIQPFFQDTPVVRHIQEADILA